MIIDDIKANNIQAIKDKNQTARNIYGVVINKYMLLNVEKRAKNEEVTDVDMVQILQKTIKELSDEMEGYNKVGNAEAVKEIEAQQQLLKAYLPEMLSEEKIKDIILNEVGDTSIPAVMKHFKANYAGKCDMGLVQKVLKSI